MIRDRHNIFYNLSIYVTIFFRFTFLPAYRIRKCQRLCFFISHACSWIRNRTTMRQFSLQVCRVLVTLFAARMLFNKISYRLCDSMIGYLIVNWYWIEVSPLLNEQMTKWHGCWISVSRLLGFGCWWLQHVFILQKWTCYKKVFVMCSNHLPLHNLQFFLISN